MCISDAASTMIRTGNVFFSLLRRSENFGKFTSIETTSLNISARAIATCLRAGGSADYTHHTRNVSELFSRFVVYRRFSIDPVNSLDVRLDVDKDVVPVVPT